MDEKQEPIEKFYTYLTKLEHKINKHIKKIQNILENPSDSDEDLDEGNLAEVEQHSQQIKKQIKKIKKQIDNALYEFQINSVDSNQLGVRYDILRESRKQLYKNNTELKSTLQKGREKVKRLKRLQNNLNSLQNQQKLQKTSVNKLQLAYNNSLKLQKQIVERVEEIDRRQRTLVYELQKQRDRDIKISQYWKNRQKYDKLVAHKNTLHKHIQSRIQQSSKIYKNKYNQLETLKNKISSYTQVYQQLEVNTNEQNFIIKEIMIRENLTAPQLILQANMQYGDQFLFQDNLDQLKDQQYLTNQIKKLKKKVGLQDSGQKYSSVGRRKRLHTDHIPSLKQYTPNKEKINTEGLQRSETTQSRLRMTTKIRLNKPKYSINVNPIKSMEIYPEKIKKLKINKTSEVKINSGYLKQKASENQSLKGQVDKIGNNLIPNNETQNLVPVTHDKISSFSTPKTINSKFTSRNSENKRANNKNEKQCTASDYENNKKQKISDLELNFRVRTKQGYVYKTKRLNYFNSESNEDDLSSNSSYFKQKSEIIQLYDKLAKQDTGKNKKNRKKIPDISDFVSSERNSEGNTNRNHSNDSLLNELNQLESSFGQNSSYVKLKCNNRKKGKQGNKQSMQSRQSDSEKMQKKQKLRNSHIKIDNMKKQERQSSKKEDFESKCEQIRKRLRTIHEKQEEILNRGNSP